MHDKERKEKIFEAGGGRRRLRSSVAWDKTNTQYLQNQKLPISFPFQANGRNGIQCNVSDQFWQRRSTHGRAFTVILLHNYEEGVEGQSLGIYS